MELYGRTLKQAIASTMRGVRSNQVTDLVVTDGAAARAAGALRALGGRALQASSVNLAYTIVTTSVYTSSQLAAQLQEALVSGDFNAVMQLLAYSNGATDLVGATSANTLETDIDEGGGGGEDSKDDEPVLSTGAIIGIAIGGAAFLVIVGVALWYFCSKSTSSVAPASASSTVAPA